jgi:hypothetical protein
MKGHDHCIKLANGETQVYLCFGNDTSEYECWLSKCQKVSQIFTTLLHGCVSTDDECILSCVLLLKRETSPYHHLTYLLTGIR